MGANLTSGPKQRYSVDTELDLYQWLVRYVKHRGVSRNQVVNEAIEALRRHVEKEGTVLPPLDPP